VLNKADQIKKEQVRTKRMMIRARVFWGSLTTLVR
jgi:hypothetical protein